MKENFLNSMFSEGGKISHKRWISVTIASVLGWCIIYALTKAGAANDRYAIITATMIFVIAMSGVATVAQIISLIRGTPLPAGTADKLDDQPYYSCASFSTFPETGELNALYLDRATNGIYQWNGTTYVPFTGPRPSRPPSIIN